VRESGRSGATPSARSSSNYSDSSARDDSGRQSPVAASRVYDSARRSADPEPAVGEVRSGRGEVDLGGFGNGRRASFPTLSASVDGVRPAPGLDDGLRTSIPVRTQPMTRASLLERYRAPQSSSADIARAREQAGKGLSSARGGTASLASSALEKPRGRSSPAVSKELRKQQYQQTTRRLASLEKTDPARAKQVMRTGEGVAIASDIALRAAIGTSFGACGSSAETCWWDPCNPGYGSAGWCGWNSCAPYSWWWWNNSCYWLPSWGWGWSWGACYGNWCFGWSSHPNYCYPGYAYWGCSPWYYSGVIYDDYDDPQVVVVHEYEEAPPAGQPAAEAPGVEAAPGVNLPPEKRDPQLAAALARSAQQYVSLGDLAFSERRFSDAVSHYAKAIEYAPGDAVLYMLLSDALFATGDYHYSASALRKALELEPRLVDTIVDKHAVYRDPADFEKQLGYLESYVKDNFLDEDARLVLAANYLFGNKPHQAFDFLQSSFSLEVRKSQAGTLLFERAQKLAAENPFSK
jgi:hypothetical protein